MYSDVYRLFMTTVIFLCQLLVVSKVKHRSSEDFIWHSCSACNISDYHSDGSTNNFPCRIETYTYNYDDTAELLEVHCYSDKI